MKHTTRFYRAEAAAEEKVLNWFRAHRLWLAAIEVYPNKSGALAKLDIQNMFKRAEACLRMDKLA